MDKLNEGMKNIHEDVFSPFLFPSSPPLAYGTHCFLTSFEDGCNYARQWPTSVFIFFPSTFLPSSPFPIRLRFLFLGVRLIRSLFPALFIFMLIVQALCFLSLCLLVCARKCEGGERGERRGDRIKERKLTSSYLRFSFLRTLVSVFVYFRFHFRFISFRLWQ